MTPRWSIGLPITLAIVLIVLLIALTIGWVLITVFSASTDPSSAALYYTLLSVGTTLLVLVVVGVVIYLTLSLKAINLTRRQSNFIDSVTHELKSPIASMRLALQTMNHRQVEPGKRDKICQYMLEDIDRLDHLINHILEAAKLAKVEMDSEEEEVALGPLLAECAHSICSRYRVDESIIELDLTPCALVAPRGDLEIIFRNLIDNAVKYAGTEPRVVIELQPAERRQVEVRITDNGPGIPRNLRRKIFGRFVRLGFELERKKPGTGLGLYIVRTLVRRLRGDVRVHDPKTGVGTVFVVRLPRALASDREPVKTSEHPADATQEESAPPAGSPTCE